MSAFTAYLAPLREAEWVVYAKPPFGGPQQALAYLGRYTHRVAISNQRLLSDQDGRVCFQWKDYRHENKQKVMAVDADEFIRRFLIHTLPPGFQRIRHFGFLANCHRRAKLALCRQLLIVPIASLLPQPAEMPSNAGSNHRRASQPLSPLRHRHNDPGWNPAVVPVACHPTTRHLMRKMAILRRFAKMPPSRQHKPKVCSYIVNTPSPMPLTADSALLSGPKQRLTFLSRLPRENTSASPKACEVTGPLSFTIQKA